MHSINFQEAVQRSYVLNGPCQLCRHFFLVRKYQLKNASSALVGINGAIELNIVFLRMPHFCLLFVQKEGVNCKG